MTLNLMQLQSFQIIKVLIGLWIGFWVSVSNASPMEALSCVVNPSKVVNIASPVAGVVDQIFVAKGEYLNKGQMILKLNSEVEKLNLRSAQAQVDFFKRKLKRNEELLKQKLISALQQDELSMDLLLAEIKRNEADSTLALKTLSSPLSGVVQQKLVEVGELVGQKPVLQILQLDPLYIEVILSQDFYEQITLGQALKFETRLGAKIQTFRGEVIVKDAMIDVASETFGIRVQVANADYRIIAGLKCTIIE